MVATSRAPPGRRNLSRAGRAGEVRLHRGGRNGREVGAARTRGVPRARAAPAVSLQPYRPLLLLRSGRDFLAGRGGGTDAVRSARSVLEDEARGPRPGCGKAD